MKIGKQQNGGIIFFQTKNLEVLTEFYINQIGCKLWLDQGGCKVFQFENMLFGLCQRDNIDDLGMITFYYSSRNEVDKMYQKFRAIAAGKPKDNSNYRIYHFFAKDPDGRNMEFQFFWDK